MDSLEEIIRHYSESEESAENIIDSLKFNGFTVKRLNQEEIKKKIYHELECFHIPFDKSNGFVSCLVRDIMQLQDKEKENG